MGIQDSFSRGSSLTMFSWETVLTDDDMSLFEVICCCCCCLCARNKFNRPIQGLLVCAFRSGFKILYPHHASTRTQASHAAIRTSLAWIHLGGATVQRVHDTESSAIESRMQRRVEASESRFPVDGCGVCQWREAHGLDA